MVVAVVGTLVVAALVLIALREPVEYDETTPEGVAQGYVRAVIAGDHLAAVEYLDDRLGCRASDFRHLHVSRSLTVRLSGVDEVGDTVHVRLVFVEHGGPFGGGWEFEDRLVMEPSDGSWLIVEPPWPTYYCAGGPGG